MDRKKLSIKKYKVNNLSSYITLKKVIFVFNKKIKVSDEINVNERFDKGLIY